MEKDWKASCKQLSLTIPAEKIFCLQISDAYKVPQPIQLQNSGPRPRRVWSDHFRPLPFEGYLPVADFVRAVLDTGYRGWFSYEIFDDGPDGTGRDYADMLPVAKKAFDCQARLIDACSRAKL